MLAASQSADFRWAWVVSVTGVSNEIPGTPGEYASLGIGVELRAGRTSVGTGDHSGRGRWDSYPVNGRAGVLALARTGVTGSLSSIHPQFRATSSVHPHHTAYPRFLSFSAHRFSDSSAFFQLSSPCRFFMSRCTSRIPNFFA